MTDGLIRQKKSAGHVLAHWNPRQYTKQNDWKEGDRISILEAPSERQVLPVESYRGAEITIVILWRHVLVGDGHFLELSSGRFNVLAMVLVPGPASNHGIGDILGWDDAWFACSQLPTTRSPTTTSTVHKLSSE